MNFLSNQIQIRHGNLEWRSLAVEGNEWNFCLKLVFIKVCVENYWMWWRQLAILRCFRCSQCNFCYRHHRIYFFLLQSKFDKICIWNTANLLFSRQRTMAYLCTHKSHSGTQTTTRLLVQCLCVVRFSSIFASNTRYNYYSSSMFGNGKCNKPK